MSLYHAPIHVGFSFVLAALSTSFCSAEAAAHSNLTTETSAPPPALYEEEPVTSMPLRVRHWEQMNAYVDRLDSTRTRTVLSAAEPSPETNSPAYLKQLLIKRTGYPPPGFLDKVEAKLSLVGEDHLGKYYRCYTTVAEGLDSYGLFLVPKQARFPAPLLIAQHGGAGYPELALFHRGINYHDMVRGGLTEGYVVYAPLTVFQPFLDRDRGTPIPQEVRAQLDGRLRSAGTSLAALEVAMISKTLDALLERAEVDSNRVAMVGLSFGGDYTLYTAALDKRIRVAVASCCFGRLGGEKFLPTNHPEGRLVDLSGPELAALICPRPLQIQSGTNDTYYPIATAREAAAQASASYAARQAGDNFDFQPFPGRHEFCGDLAWKFLRQHLATLSP